MKLKKFNTRRFESWLQLMRTSEPLALVLYIVQDVNGRGNPRGPKVPGGKFDNGMTEHDLYAELLLDEDELRSRFEQGFARYFAGDPEPTEVAMDLCSIWELLCPRTIERLEKQPTFPLVLFNWIERRLESILALPFIAPTGYNVGPFNILRSLFQLNHSRLPAEISAERIHAVAVRLMESDEGFSNVGWYMLVPVDPKKAVDTFPRYIALNPVECNVTLNSGIRALCENGGREFLQARVDSHRPSLDRIDRAFLNYLTRSEQGLVST